MGAKMKVTVSNTILIEDPTDAVKRWCHKNLTIPNPEYTKKARMHLWLGHTPPKISFYEQHGNAIVLPFGTLRQLPLADAVYESNFADSAMVDYCAEVPLYDYQTEAVDQVFAQHYGILQAPAGSGKTQMGIALIKRFRRRALWLTHTLDLLKQSKSRAEQYMSADLIGTVTEGKVNLGKGITFATIQTMCKLDLARYKDYFDVIVVDECFPAGTLIQTSHGKVPIQFIIPGELILTRNELSGKLELSEVEELQVRIPKAELLKIVLENGTDICCTSNHPFYTKDGYKKASELSNGNDVLVLRKGFRYFDYEQYPKIRCSSGRETTSLFKRVFRDSAETTHCVDRRTESNISKIDAGDKPEIRVLSNEKEQSYESPRSERKGFAGFTKQKSSSSKARRKWARTDSATKNPFGKVATFTPSNRICCTNSIEKLRLSDTLQNRYCVSEPTGGGRGRRWFTWLSKSADRRYEKNRVLNWVRVASVEVLQPGSNGEYGKVCAENRVYNLAVKHNHNYFANGVLAHNCHRVAGSPTAVTQFSKVLNALAARHKIGLSATVHRSDGLIVATHALLGEIVHIVPEQAVGDRILKVGINPIGTGIELTRECLNTDGTLNYTKLISHLCSDFGRNMLIADCISKEWERPCLILSDRLEHLETIMRLLPKSMQSFAVMISGKMTSVRGKAEREQAIEDMRKGHKRYLFATYALAKEGLDIPRLERLFMATPQKDYAIVTQSVGRIARTHDGKANPIVYDFVDNIAYLVKSYKKRCTTYRKNGCYFEEGRSCD